MIGLFRGLLAALRRLWSRRGARKLIAAGLPRGLSEAPRPLLSLRVPPSVAPRETDFHGLPLGAHAIRGRRPPLLLRLSALPPRPMALRSPLRPRPLLDPPRWQPRLLSPIPPLQTRVVDLGIVRPRVFRLDAELRMPVEVDPPRLAADSPAPVRRRRVRPRTPLARAPLARLRPRSLRLDPRTLAPANEGILPTERRDLAFCWVRPDFRREIVDLQWMATDRIAFLAPQPVEWFTMWWFETQQRSPGGRESVPYELPRELGWALEHCKEQMLIRRDVKKDETAMEPAAFKTQPAGVNMGDIEQVPLTALIPKTEWIEPCDMSPRELPFEPRARTAYLEWRTLLGYLQER